MTRARNGSTPVSHHTTTRSRKVDANVDPAKFRRLCSASPRLGFVVPCWCGGGWAPPYGVGPAALWVRALDKYLDPVGDRDRCGPQNSAYGSTKISGDRPRGLAMQGVTSELATCGQVQDLLAQGILNKKITIRVCGWG